MKTENRHINIQEPEGMMLLRYIKDTASNEEKSYIEAWLEADENNKRILLQTARHIELPLSLNLNRLQRFVS